MGGNRGLYFIVGALVVAVAVLGFMFFQDQQNDVDIKIDVPGIGKGN